MIRAFPSRFAVLAAVVSLLLASTFLAEPRAHGTESSDRALAQKLLGPGDVLDPVLAALSEGRLVRDVAAPLAGQVELPAVPLGFALTGAQLLALDVTGTLEATQEVDAFVARLRSRGIETEGTKWTVYTLPSVKEALDVAGGRGEGDTDDGPLASALVVPAGTKVELVGAVFEGGQLHAKTVITAAPSGRASSATSQRKGFRTMAAPSDSADFIRDGGMGCIKRKQNDTAWYDPCQEFHWLQNDGDPHRGYWASEMRGTGKGKGIWTLNRLEVSSRRADGSPAQEWVDWDPGADSETNCHSQTVGVGYAGASVSVTQQHCELWDIDKGEEAADFANWWRGHVRRKERETAAFTLTRLKNGDLPALTLDFDYYANP